MEQLSSEKRLRYGKEIENLCRSLDFDVSSQQIEALLDYLALFIKWNKAYNLSAIRDTDEMLSKHLLDSLVIAPHLRDDPKAQRLIDVGTGGGLPGIPMAICFPDRDFTLLDSAGKKMRFLYQVKLSLKLDNVSLENRRVETFKPSPLFDGVLSRAFASITDMTHWCDHLLHEDGRFWAMKGVFPDQELRELAKSYIVEHHYDLDVPSLTGERCLVVLRRV